MKALILANGRATRLGPLSQRLSKALMPVANRPVIWYVIQNLRQAGIERVAITIGPNTAEVVNYVKSVTDLGIAIDWLWERRRTGTGGALRDHGAYFDGEPVVVVPADIITNVDILSMIRQHERDQPSVTVAVMPREPSTWHGDIIVASGPHATAYLFKPGPGAPANHASTGAWIVTASALTLVPAEGFCDFSADVLPSLPAPGLALGAYHAGSVYQRDVGVLSWLYAANMETLAGISPAAAHLPPPILKKAGRDSFVVRGPVLIGSGARIDETAQIYGPAVIGPDAVVEAGAAVAASVILPGARVPAGALISTAVYGAGTPSAHLRPIDAQAPQRLIVTDHDDEDWYR